MPSARPAPTCSPDAGLGVSTIGPGGLDFRVRNGNGYFSAGIGTGLAEGIRVISSQSQTHVCAKGTGPGRATASAGSSNISKPHGRLVRVACACRHACSLRLSTRWSTGGLQGLSSGETLSWDGFRAYMLSALIPSALRYPAYAPGGTAGTREARPPGSSRTAGSFPQVSSAHSR